MHYVHTVVIVKPFVCFCRIVARAGILFLRPNYWSAAMPERNQHFAVTVFIVVIYGIEANCSKNR